MKNLNSKKTENYIWLSISLFCDTEFWRGVHDICIYKILKQGLSTNYIVKLHFSQNRQLDLFFKVAEFQKKRSAMLIDEILTSFLLTLPKPTLVEEEEFVFQPFPKNSVQYGIMGGWGTEHKPLQRMISNINKKLIAWDLTYEEVLVHLFLLYSIILSEFERVYQNFPNIYIEKLETQSSVKDILKFSGLYDSEFDLLNSLNVDIETSDLYSDFPYLKPVLQYIQKSIAKSPSILEDLNAAKGLADDLFKIVNSFLDVELFMKWSVIYAVKAVQKPR